MSSSAATVLNSIQPQLQAGAQTVFQPQTASIQPVQTAVPQVTPQPAQATSTQVTTVQNSSAASTVSPSNISVAALQTAGLSINPAIVRLRKLSSVEMFSLPSPQFQLLFFSFTQISAASLGAQPQFLTSLTSTPIISSAISSMAGITSQIITNAQGQVNVDHNSRPHLSVCASLNKLYLFENCNHLTPEL